MATTISRCYLTANQSQPLPGGQEGHAGPYPFAAPWHYNGFVRWLNSQQDITLYLHSQCTATALHYVISDLTPRLRALGLAIPAILGEPKGAGAMVPTGTLPVFCAGDCKKSVGTLLAL
jgi:hypothetical protein